MSSDQVAGLLAPQMGRQRGAGRERWWDRPFRTFQTNLREIDAGVDVERELDVIEAYGADVWLLSTAGIIANYPSTLPSQTVNPALAERPSGDLIGDAVTAARARGLRVLGRMDFSKVDARRAEAHPEWCFVTASGEPQVYNGYASVCPSGPYYQEVMFDVITEVLEEYALSGFFFNWMSFNEYDYSRRYWGVCHCEGCRRGFRRFALGADLPVDTSSPTYSTWQAYTAGVLADLHARMSAHVRALNPDAALIQGNRADITFYEANNAVGRPLWHHATAEAVSSARSIDPARPVLVNSVGFIDMPYRWAGEDPNQFAQYLLQAMAHGAQPSTYIMGTTSDSPYQALDLGGRIVRFHRDNEELYDRLQSTAQVALIRPATHGADAHRRRAEFQGLYLSLIEHHVPFDVIGTDHLADLDPRRFRLLILADVGVLDPDQVSSLERVLAAGARIVATGDSAWKDGRPQLGPTPLARHLVTFRTEESVRSLHLDLRQDGDLAPVVGGFSVVQPADRAHTGWPAIGRARYGPPEQCYGHHRTAHPGWISGRVGAGELALVPWRPGLVYREIGLARVRDAWVRQVLGADARTLQIDTDLPAQVQIVPGRAADGRTVLHLLNRSGDAPQRFMEPVPIGPGRIRLPAPDELAQVRARVAGTDLAARIDDGVLEIELPQIGRFEVIDITRAS